MIQHVDDDDTVLLFASTSTTYLKTAQEKKSVGYMECHT